MDVKSYVAPGSSRSDPLMVQLFARAKVISVTCRPNATYRIVYRDDDGKRSLMEAKNIEAALFKLAKPKIQAE